MATEEEIGRAVVALWEGGLVAFPTETVYGLGADAANEDAVRRLFAAKGRPADHPVIVHLARVAQMDEWASDVPEAARVLADAFWPGPLTLIVPRAAHVSDAVTGGQESVGLRVPSHPVANLLLTSFGGGLAAPSANRFGRISPTRPEHVRAEFDEATVPIILDGDAPEVGVESTIVDCTGPYPILLRPGGVTPAQLAAVLGEMPAAPPAAATRASGTLRSHYAPITPLEIVAAPNGYFDIVRLAQARMAAGERVAGLARIPEAFAQGGPYRYEGVIAANTGKPGEAQMSFPFVFAPRDAAGYARHLYAMLRDLDAVGAARILVEAVPGGEEWLAVRDRLQRAAATPGEASSPKFRVPGEGGPPGAQGAAVSPPGEEAAPVTESSELGTRNSPGTQHAAYRPEGTHTQHSPLVAVVMGSTSDWETMRHAVETLEGFGVAHERRVVSAHRTPHDMARFAAEAEGRGLEVVIAGAGGAAHLPGMIAASTLVPVLGVPVESHALKGMDSLLSIVQMPGGVPVGTLAIGRAGAINAALLAVAILSNTRPELREKLRRFRAEQAARVRGAVLP